MSNVSYENWRFFTLMLSFEFKGNSYEYNSNGHITNTGTRNRQLILFINDCYSLFSYITIVGF